MWLSERSLQPEIMDEYTPAPEVVDEVFWFLGLINRWLGGTRASLSRFEEFSRSWRPGQRIDVLEVACGGGDFARSLIHWGRDRGFDVRVTALDISPRVLSTASRRGDSATRPRWLCGDVLCPPLRDGSFDYVVSALFFHHLSDADVVRTLRLFDRLTTRGIVVNDLIRRRRHYFWSWLFTRPFNSILRHDGPLSVRRAFIPRELETLARRSGLSWVSIQTHFGHRMTLAGERTTREARPPICRD